MESDMPLILVILIVMARYSIENSKVDTLEGAVVYDRVILKAGFLTRVSMRSAKTRPPSGFQGTLR
jgi:hypothetical protein